MFSSRALKGIIASSLLFTVALHAQQPINLDDAAHTFSSMKIPSILEPRTFIPYFLSGVATYLASSFCYLLAAGAYARYYSLPWWQAMNKTQLTVARGIQVTATALALHTTHTTTETYRRSLDSIRTKARDIVGDSSFLDAIRTDNVEHMNAWIEYTEIRTQLDYGDVPTRYFAQRDQNGRTPIMLATLANSTKVLELMLSYQKEYSAIDACDNQGNSALHMAFQNKHYEAADLLVKHGANKHAKNNAGKLPGDFIECSPAAASALGIEQTAHADSNTHNSYDQKAKDYLIVAIVGITSFILARQFGKRI